MSDTRIATRPYIIGGTNSSFVVPAAGGKVLLGDAGITADRYFGLRAYSTASIGSVAIGLTRGSGGSTNIVTVAGGGLDYTAINAFDDSSGLTVVAWHNQTGVAESLVPLAFPTFNKNGGGFQVPTISVVNGSNNQFLDVTTFPNFTNPFAIAAYVNHTAGAGGSVAGDNSANFIGFLFASDTELGVYQNNDFVTHYGVPGNITSGAYHGILGLFNGASSAINVDGSDSVGASGGTNTLAANSCGVCGGQGFGTQFTGTVTEFAFFGGANAPNATQRSTITNNMKNWWGL